VLAVDRAADWLITVGGLLVIVAVFGIMAFLVQVVVPLFTGGHLDGRVQHALADVNSTVLSATDEYHTVSALVQKDGRVRVAHIATGKRLGDLKFDFAGKTGTAFAQTLAGQDVAFGFEDGTVAFGTLTLVATILKADQAPADLRPLNDRDLTDGHSVFSRIPGDQFRQIEVKTDLQAPQKIADSPIIAVDYHIAGTAERPTRTFVTVDQAGVVRLSRAESRVNAMTGKVRTTVASAELPDVPKGVDLSRAITVDTGDQVYLPHQSGVVYRYDTRDFRAPKLAERVRLVPEGAQLTAFGFLIGEQSLFVGGSDGTADIYFRLQRPDTKSTDGFTLVRAHRMENQGAAITGFAPSPRSKMFATADAGGNIWVRHSTSEQTLLKLAKGGAASAYSSLVMSPREDGVLAVSADGKATFWGIHVPHPETTWSTIFGKVWYEGYDKPELTWQSSSGTDQFEPKFSLVPLIFGTIKATVYALLFAIPIALTAAIYTSEFVHPLVRQTVKPAMEMMASLPSVVLGFIAALILAPIVETWIAAVLMVFVAVPLALMVGGYLWQFLPGFVARRFQGLARFGLMFAMLLLAFWICYRLGWVFEELVFEGDLKAWANGDIGSGVPFMTLVLTPVCTFALGFGLRGLLGDAVRDRMRAMSPTGAAIADLVRWIVMLAAAVGVAYLVAALLGALGFDPRGGVVSTYVQRNTLVVGFAMGFAVIPIIYTISEDALNSVPEHLRAAALACGATTWQTATKVILPTAMSGVFAAVMVGMGRAVGETMIVVMAAGNTPILEWNIFNGLRALSANIAVELPEAVKDGSLFRMLFLAALTLFVMTFVVNTIAEVIRQRFRRRAISL
jgi:phosphate transport system permease protein